jgi:hypothetical protein
MTDPPVVVAPPADNVLLSVWNERVREERVISKERDTIEIMYFFCLAKSKKEREKIQKRWGPQLFHFSPAMRRKTHKTCCLFKLSTIPSLIM